MKDLCIKIMLLDTHTLIWFFDDNPKLPSAVKERIENADTVFASIINFWEIAIKLGLGKLEIKYSFHELPQLLNQLEIQLLPLSFADTEQYLTLPLYHRDPFDRMLVAQSITNSLIIISQDKQLDSYPIQRFWA
ncbi:type II toxin-antitoxin system VapC family toxin [Phormidesmis sp. 146-12]